MKTNDQLRNDVMDEIKWDPRLRDVHTQIGVAVKDGVVTLSGIVDSYGKKLSAEKAAQRVQGVKVVACDIDVHLDPASIKSDPEIADAVRRSLKWNNAVNDDKIEVKVDEGWVTLEGEVEWAYEKITAQSDVEGLIGVRGVTNNIRIRTQAINTREMENKIAAAFHRNAGLDANNISFEVSRGRVTLKGTVSSWAEKETAEQIAWSSPGVLIVDNQINIDSEIFAGLD